MVKKGHNFRIIGQMRTNLGEAEKEVPLDMAMRGRKRVISPFHEPFAVLHLPPTKPSANGFREQPMMAHEEEIKMGRNWHKKVTAAKQQNLLNTSNNSRLHFLYAALLFWQVESQKFICDELDGKGSFHPLLRWIKEKAMFFAVLMAAAH